MKFVPQEHVQNHTVEQLVDVPDSREEIVPQNIVVCTHLEVGQR